MNKNWFVFIGLWILISIGVWFVIHTIVYGYSDTQRDYIRTHGGYFIGDYQFLKDGKIYNVGLMSSTNATVGVLLVVGGLISTIGYVGIKEYTQ